MHRTCIIIGYNIPNTYGHVFVQGKKEGKKYIYHQRKFSNTTFMDGDEK